MNCSGQVYSYIDCLNEVQNHKKIKLSGVDIEVELAKKGKIPVALVGTVGGRSSEYAFEMLDNQKDWGELNPWGRNGSEFFSSFTAGE